MLWRVVLLCLLCAGAVRAETVVAGLSQTSVSITTDFAGSEILIFGAVKREAPLPEDGQLDVVITVAGPAMPVTVRQKDRRLGIWINTDSVHIDAAPSFYAVSSTRPLDDIMSDTEDLRHKVSIPRAIRAVGATEEAPHAESFVEALIRIRTAKGLYQMLPGAVSLDEQTLFRTSIALPANLTEGDYTTRIYLVRNGEVIDAYETTLAVQKVGLERWTYTLAHQRPLIYGLLSLTIAIFAGWGASAVFRLIKN
ncbi:putative transmembrane protein [Rhodovulum sp. P5]|uniref:TIGR02186 family protein n=1 Tax=Rhodovulum sp. P5 TaxID=1564506 RepID=UPI0009C1DB0E|nr:TIGR02186 family protein [Rhodovulum sp. P5]ARE38745.1 putative transmembrane protein [Rhodovulum sp. P5]